MTQSEEGALPPLHQGHGALSSESWLRADSHTLGLRAPASDPLEPGLVRDRPAREALDRLDLQAGRLDERTPFVLAVGAYVARVADAVRRVERQAIIDALKAEAGSPARAARRLGISRASFYNYLKTEGADLPSFEVLKRAHDLWNLNFNYIDFGARVKSTIP